MTFSSRAATAAALLLLPLAASAHEHRTYEIGGKEYVIEIGSINEPVTVDDKSGVELTVSEVAPHDGVAPHNDDEEHEEGAPVTGLERTLKVEVRAGDQTMTLDFRPTWGAPGAYEAIFFPTAETTYTYRLTGTIDDIPVDLSFACKPSGAEEAPEETTAVKLSDRVTQIRKEGAFGCPSAKAPLQFPAKPGSLADMGGKTRGVDPLSAASLAFGIIGFVTGSAALRKAKRA